MKCVANLNRKLSNLENHKKYLTACRRNHVLPSHISNSMKFLNTYLSESSPFTNKCQKILRNFQKKILNMEINYTHWKSQLTKTSIDCNKLYIQNHVPPDTFDKFVQAQYNFYVKNKNAVKKKQIAKLNKILRSQKVHQYTSSFSLHEIEKKWCVNLTNKPLPNNVCLVLSLGDKFNLPYSNDNLPIKQTIIDTECIIDQIQDEEQKIQKRNQFVNIFSNFINNTKKPQDHLTILDDNNKLIPFSQALKDTKLFIKQEDILVTKADKGNVTVVIKKEDFHKKTSELLSDVSTYKVLSKDPTISIQNRNNKIIDLYFKQKILSQATAKKLKTNSAIPPKIYFLPKVHKPGAPLRPIVSFIGSPLYQTSQFVAEILKHGFIKDQKHVRNSFSVVETVKDICLPKGYILVSLDVVSLFTNIPTDLTLDIIKSRWNVIKNNTSLSLEMFTNLFNLVIDNNYFVYNKKIYQQIYGLGMGNCMSPVCSDIVMSELQNICLHKLSFDVPIFLRYVDDIFLSVPANKTDELLSTFNDYHPRLKFTLEIEKDNKLPFLDLLIIRQNDGHLITDWYHKPTFSERFLNYNSDHPQSQKINIINNLKNRALTLSHSTFKQKNLALIRKFLIKNKYPANLVDRLLNRNNTNIPLPAQKDTNGKFFKIPYVRNLSEKIKHLLLDVNVNVAFKSENTIKKHFFTKLKDKTDVNLQSNVVYKIPCLECEKIYIGQTGRYLKTRMSEHRRDCRNFHINKESKTALFEHVISEGHFFDFENVQVIGTQNILKKRLLDEMIEIRRHSNTVNKRTDIENLNTCYYNLISKI